MHIAANSSSCMITLKVTHSLSDRRMQTAEEALSDSREFNGRNRTHTDTFDIARVDSQRDWKHTMSQHTLHSNVWQRPRRDDLWRKFYERTKILKMNETVECFVSSSERWDSVDDSFKQGTKDGGWAKRDAHVCRKFWEWTKCWRRMRLLYASFPWAKDRTPSTIRSNRGRMAEGEQAPLLSDLRSLTRSFAIGHAALEALA